MRVTVRNEQQRLALSVLEETRSNGSRGRRQQPGQKQFGDDEIQWLSRLETTARPETTFGQVQSRPTQDKIRVVQINDSAIAPWRELLSKALVCSFCPPREDFVGLLDWCRKY
ncbi:hypothetical protein AMTR_s00113p00116210 [Amborella trichopoda]|uniref:Uncharacterized protein n=1 Tax=Amborella trichopoda TaxID=13333 RepID=W1NRM3_AMBTC|nr:hypothetical protein AMTR_s00113p00116210 [Amborella trichopoda]